MLFVLLIIIGLSALIIIHEAGHFLSAKWFGLLVEEFGFGLPPRLWGKKIRETIYSFNWLPFGGFVRIYGEKRGEEKSGIDAARSFSHQPVYKRALIIVAGVLMNFLLGWVLIAAVHMIGIPQALLITGVKEQSIASDAGILKGDRILDFKTVAEFINFINDGRGREISLRIKRNDKEILVKIVPRILVPEGEGNLGVYLTESGLPKLGILESFWQGLKTALQITEEIFLGFVDLIAGVFTDISVLERFIGPVGIVNVAIETTKLGLVPFLQLLSMISLNLAVFNIFPIPALDGGRLLFLLIEKLKGSPLNLKTEMAINGLGFAFLIFLILAITVRDILTLL